MLHTAYDKDGLVVAVKLLSDIGDTQRTAMLKRQMTLKAN